MKKEVLRAGSILVALLIVAPFSARAEEKKEIDLRPVLLVVDLQNRYLPMMAEGDRASAPAKINEAIGLFRKSGDPIVVVYHTDPKRGPEPGTEPFHFPDWVAVTPDDPVIVKSYPSAFTHTDLDALLKKDDRNAVFLCGLSAAGCVLATYFGALDRDYKAFMVKDALLSHDSSCTKMIEDICYSVPMEELAAALKKRQ